MPTDSIIQEFVFYFMRTYSPLRNPLVLDDDFSHMARPYLNTTYNRSVNSKVVN
jgi:hypothetical protein